MARLSGDIVRLADQKITRDWWDTQRSHFDLVTSELVILESSAGDPAAAKERLAVLQELQLVNSNDDAESLASALLAAAALSSKAARDALHVGIAATNGVGYLLTWNCIHLANAILQDKIAETCSVHGFRPPRIITPNQLFDEAFYERRNRLD